MPLYLFKTQYIVLSGALNINDKPFMASNSRPRNVACNLRAKAIMTDFVLCRNLFGYFFSYEKVMTEKTTNKQQLKAIMVRKAVE